METKKHRKQRNLLIAIIAVLLLIILLLSLRCCQGSPADPQTPNLDNNAVDWQGSQQLQTPNNQGSSGKISIPCFESLLFTANEKTQKINLYNPASNRCYFVITLKVNDEVLFKSEMIAPNKGFYEIELLDTLEAGDYVCIVIYETFSTADLTPMNGGSFDFDLKVQ